MSWFTFTLLAVVVFSAYSIFVRLFLADRGDAQTFALLLNVSMAVFLLGVLVPLTDLRADLSVGTIALIGIASALYALASMLITWARQLEEASRVSVTRQTGAIWVFAGGILVLDESLTIGKIIGTTLVVIGTILATWDKAGIRPSKGLAMILVGVFIGSASALIGKTVVESSVSPALYAGSRALIAAMLLTIFLPDVVSRARQEISLQQLRIPAVGLLLGMNFFLLYKALEIGDASSVRPVFGSATILTVAAAILFLGERDRILQKIVGAAFVVAGVVFFRMV